ncbi:hypothetical protein [Shewanella sp. UCD-KL12]|uniref:hypothetical protein n=1 Tax=Shewanella sp. UCD-KL12 TaxID=1917163 RepID=UPI0009703FEC|nr:hypothetical protein [Shewanella sp. UCD-KL12]
MSVRSLFRITTPLFAFSALVLLFTATANAQTNEININPFIGSWQLASGKYLDDKGEWQDYAALNLKAIKVISASHFSFTTMKEVEKEGVTKQEFWAAGTGHYEFTDSRYIEYPQLNSFGVAEGESFAFEYEIKGQELHTKRVEKDVLKEVEVWLRLD